MEPCVASSHERNPLNEAFHRYCKWNNLPIDDEGFLNAKVEEVESDLKDHVFSFEASPHLSLSVQELYDRFDARFVLLLRRPDKVVTSFAHKGFYRRAYVKKDSKMVIGSQYPETEKFEYSLARIAPNGDEFLEWNQMTYVGKNAWFWSAYNKKIIELLSSIPDENYRVLKIEEFNYEQYRETAEFLGIEAKVKRKIFEDLSASKPHSFTKKRNIDVWSDSEIKEFESQVQDLATELKYEFRVERLLAEPQNRPPERPAKRRRGPRLWNLRRSTAQKLRDLATFVDCGTDIGLQQRTKRGSNEPT
jgi:hypothetical protein